VSVSGTIDPSAAAAGVYVYEIDGIAPCVSDQASVSVSVSQPADAGLDAIITVCNDAAPFALFPLLGGSPDAGGSWSAPGGGAYTGPFDPSADLAGGYTYTVTAPAPCPQDQSVLTIDVIDVPAPVITCSGSAGCVPLATVFTSDYIEGGTCFWDFGNGVTSTDCEPDTVIYSDPGSYRHLDHRSGLRLCVHNGVRGSDRGRGTTGGWLHGDTALVNTADPVVYFNNTSEAA
jgi:hypothetical protein